MVALHLLATGPLCTLQDAGRSGFLAQGITPAGPMDWLSHAEAARLAGNAPGSTAVEVGPGGLSLTAKGAPVRLGLSARGFRVLRDGSALPTRAAITLYPGERLDILPGHEGVWAYLAPAGGFDLPRVMGSHATHLRSLLGPLDGGALRAGAVLPVRPADPGQEDLCLPRPSTREDAPIRFIPGPQDDHFPASTHALLQASIWRVGARSDRMAYRLDGPRLAHLAGHDIVSDGVALGSIQVPGDGAPLVLMADRQPTGGYPKIGCVIRADLPRLSQMRAGEALRLAAVTPDQALAAWAGARDGLARLPEGLRRMRRWTGPGA